jgi:hypothetical protein
MTLVLDLGPVAHGYLNTDLILDCLECPEVLLQAISDAGVSELVRRQVDDDSWRVVLETWQDRKTPTETILVILEAIESLPSALQDIWNNCLNRTLDVGFRASRQRGHRQFSLDAELLGRMNALQLQLVVTIYSPEKE